jgi:hypothetical protein
VGKCGFVSCKFQMKKYYILLISFLTGLVFSQTDYQARQLVLSQDQVDSLFIFGKWNKNGGTETHIKYLGSVQTNDGRTFKVLNYTWHWGLSHRATTRILFYNEKNQYLGNYYLDVVEYLPQKLENGILIFVMNNRQKTEIDLKRGLPTLLCIKGADTCKFSSE